MKNFYKDWNKILWAGLLFVALSFVSSIVFRPLTFDLTAQKLHTLSQGSKEILRKLPEAVTFKFYYSKTAASKGSEQIRVFNNHYEYTKELLQLFESHSQNKVKLVVVDPRPDTNEEEEAVMSGLKKFQLTDTETYIFGLVAQSSSGTQKVIEFFDPMHAEKLEYEISKLLTSLYQSNKKRLGIISQEELTSGQEWWVSQLFDDLYTTTSIAKDVTEIKDVDIVLLFGAKGLQEKAVKALDQFVVNGGRVFMAVDPRQSWAAQEDSQLSVLVSLLKAWGLSIPENKFAGDLQYAAYGRTSSFMPAQRLLPVFQCQGKCLKEVESPTTASFNQLTFVYPGVIQNEGLSKDLKLQPLVQTSAKGNVYEDTGYGLHSPQTVIERFREGDKPVIIAARLDGNFPAAFSETKVPADRKAGSVVLVADQDFLRNEFAFSREFLGARPANDNVAFLLNNLDALTGSQDLMEIRSRGTVTRPFTTIQKIQLASDQETIGKVSSINASIARFQSELSGLASKANENNLGVIQSEGLRKQKELQQEIARMKRELREVKRAGRERVEQIGSALYFFNVAAVPIFLVIIYFVIQNKHKKLIKQEGGKGYENYDHAKTA
ncbi:MAG: GldG family protein [Bacteriovoracaceae bacterium]|nr:GldG family protein [Bacteriovoracaceae bacterium]